MVSYLLSVRNVMRKQIKLQQEQIIPFINLVNEVCEVGFLSEHSQVGHWLAEPREFLDNKSPMDLINNQEDLSKLWHLLRFIETGEADAWEPLEYRNAQDRIRCGDAPSTYK